MSSRVGNSKAFNEVGEFNLLNFFDIILCLHIEIDIDDLV